VGAVRPGRSHPYRGPVDAIDAAYELTGAQRRLRSELVDDGIVVDAGDHALSVILEELDYARRPPLFERRAPLYGAFVVPDNRSLVRAGDLVDLLDLDDMSLEEARRFADGRSTYLVRRLEGPLQLACFRRSVQYEADLVEIQDNTGAHIVQRTVMGVAKLFTAAGAVEWAGYRWSTRPNAGTLFAALRPMVPAVPPRVLGGMLKLAVHWLSPGRVGATLVVHGEGDRADGLDVDHSIVSPGLSIVARHHYPALYAVLMQSDLAAVLDTTGAVVRLGVGLRSSSDAYAEVEDARGMRHRSAARYTFDHPDALAVVVSEDGPVTVFHRGRALSECAAPAT
jgi:DNA integrity scanning protein DisA with diadenylate cyclase activity